MRRSFLRKPPTLRLLGGTKRGLLLQTNSAQGMRPTTARARKSLFDTLAHRPALHTEFATNSSPWMLDAFAGSGALGLEALSRWQGHGIFVEQHPTTAQILHDNIERSTLRGKVLRANALTPPPASAPNILARGTIKLAFFDPPYATKEEVANSAAAFVKQGWFAEGALLVFVRATTQEPLFDLEEEIFAPLGNLSSSSTRFLFFRYASPSCVASSLQAASAQTSERA